MKSQKKPYYKTIKDISLLSMLQAVPLDIEF